MRTLIIGCGNPERGDDAAGILVARRLREMGLPALEQPGEAIALMESWREAESVILVDAMVTGGQPGEVRLWDARNERLSRRAFQCSTHNFGLADAVELGRILECLPPRLWVYGIEAERFETGSAPSPAVLEAVDRLAERIAREASQCTSLH